MRTRFLPLITGFLLALFGMGQGPAHQVQQRMSDLGLSSTAFTPVRLFTAVEVSPTTNALWNEACTQATVLQYDANAGVELLRTRPSFISVIVADGSGSNTLDLERVDITAKGFSVRVASTGASVQAAPGLHYRGSVRGDHGSLVALSVFEQEVMAIIGDASGDRVIGRFVGDTEGLHVFYREGDLRGTNTTACGTPDLAPMHDAVERRGDGATKTMRCVHIYWEAANDLFLNKGSVANVTNYLTGLFNQMATIYANDGVQVLLNEIYVWDVASPYNGTSSGSRLNQFGTTRTSFNGELAHLIDLGGYGGVAWLSTLCAGTSSRMAYSGINTTFSTVPTYSWSVEVVTHETGHNLGSSHTHACVWNGDNTAIDGCGPAAGYTEGSCAAGPIPTSAVGGTIMSYCHLVSAGIRFQNGFGPQPAQVIRDRVNAATCLLQCGTSCDAPTPLTVTGLNSTAATLNWANYGAVSYTLRWKATSSGTWNTIPGLTTTSYAITGLTQSTDYEYQVFCVCSGSNSAYSASKVFTTPVPCPDSNEPNNTTGTAPLVTLPTAVNALIATNTDVDYYKFTLAATSNVNLYLGNLPDDYDMRLLNSGGTQLAISQNGGISSESISYANATAGTYYIHVYGYNGAFNTSQCYLLNASSYLACTAPQGLSSTNITYNSATINWVAVSGVSTYDLRWKPSSGSTWTDVLGFATNTYALSGLTQLTSYDVQVRSVCSGGVQGSSSVYTTSHTFTTLQAPCDVIPLTVVAAKVILDGAYRSGSGLMVDSLRKLNYLPTTEPYTAMGFTVSGPTTTNASVFITTGNNAIVDWVLVELRSTSSPFTVLEARVGLVQRDGDIVATDGTSPLGFCQDPGIFRVSVRHRNHLGCMSANNIALSGTSTAIDFTSLSFATYGTNACKNLGSLQALWSGNVLFNTDLKYVGANNDRDPILTAIGGTIPTNVVLGYLASDVNLDGRAKYVGSENDRDPILTNIGGSVPTAVMAEQLP